MASTPAISLGNLTYCEEVRLTFSGGRAPYTIYPIRSGAQMAEPLERLPNQAAAGSFTWKVDLKPSDTPSVTLVVVDADHQIAFSEPKEIHQGSTTSCPLNSYSQQPAVPTATILGVVLALVVVLAASGLTYYYLRLRRNKGLESPADGSNEKDAQVVPLGAKKKGDKHGFAKLHPNATRYSEFYDPSPSAARVRDSRFSVLDFYGAGGNDQSSEKTEWLAVPTPAREKRNTRQGTFNLPGVQLNRWSLSKWAGNGQGAQQQQQQQERERPESTYSMRSGSRMKEDEMAERRGSTMRGPGYWAAHGN